MSNDSWGVIRWGLGQDKDCSGGRGRTFEEIAKAEKKQSSEKKR